MKNKSSSLPRNSAIFLVCLYIFVYCFIKWIYIEKMTSFEMFGDLTNHELTLEWSALIRKPFDQCSREGNLTSIIFDDSQLIKNR